MPSEQRLVLDCIIFGLQHFGGISNYWAKLLDFILVSPQLSSRLILPSRVSFRNFKPAWTGRALERQERLPARYNRYMRVPLSRAMDIFHTSYYRLPQGSSSRYIVSAYDFTYERYRTGIPRIIHSTQKLASLRRADAVLCISESTKRDVLQYCPGIDPLKLSVTHLGVDTDDFFPDPEPGASNERMVLYVGQRDGYKRFDLAVEALRQCPQLTLGIVGPALRSSERNMLRASLGVRWQEFGLVSTDELRHLYSTAFAFVFPSDYEGFGLPVLEAMACGCPVVAASTSSLPEVGAAAALYAEKQSGESFACKLETLTSDTSRRTAMHAGIARAAEFSWSKTFDKTLSVYLGT